MERGEMMIRWIGLALALGSMGACSPQMRHVDIDAEGYESRPLGGRELLRAAENHALAALWQFGDIEMLILNADLPEQEKTRIRQRVDFLMTTIFESRGMSSKYLSPSFSEADRRQVFRAVQDRLKKTTQELIEIKSSLRRATKAEEAAGPDQE
jgi:hypothetical protein